MRCTLLATGSTNGLRLARTAVSDVVIRQARPSDQISIVALTRNCGLNADEARWSNCVVAERDNALLGSARLRVHRDGARELCSLAVAPQSRGNGIAARMIEDLVLAHSGPIHIVTAARYANYYRRWGFIAARPEDAPPSVRRNWQFAKLARLLWSDRHQLGDAPIILRRSVGAEERPLGR